jgi:oligopeptide transport system ATP-binding protein
VAHLFSGTSDYADYVVIQLARELVPYRFGPAATLETPNSWRKIMANATKALLEVDGLHVSFLGPLHRTKVLNGVSIKVGRGEVLAILGESGSGKSVTASSLMGLIDQPPGRIEAGRAMFEGLDLLAIDPKEHRALCGQRISMIFQDALTSLNPVYSVGWQIAEVFRIHDSLNADSAWHQAITLMESVGIPDAAQRALQYPHQFSGGMCQRVMIAMAIAMKPSLVIADEPTTALDVTIQAQIVELLKVLRDDTGASLILITHDLGLAAELADRVVVMYGGRVVEEGSITDIFDAPLHPYTQALLASQPNLNHEGGELIAIPGMPPNPAFPVSGCSFHPRCSSAEAACSIEQPSTVTVSPGRRAACHLVVAGLQ